MGHRLVKPFQALPSTYRTCGSDHIHYIKNSLTTKLAYDRLHVVMGCEDVGEKPNRTLVPSLGGPAFSTKETGKPSRRKEVRMSDRVVCTEAGAHLVA
jgi:hypothetical protein